MLPFQLHIRGQDASSKHRYVCVLLMCHHLTRTLCAATASRHNAADLLPGSLDPAQPPAPPGHSHDGGEWGAALPGRCQPCRGHRAAPSRCGRLQASWYGLRIAEVTWPCICSTCEPVCWVSALPAEGRGRRSSLMQGRKVGQSDAAACWTTCLGITAAGKAHCVAPGLSSQHGPAAPNRHSSVHAPSAALRLHCTHKVPAEPSPKLQTLTAPAQLDTGLAGHPAWLSWSRVQACLVPTPCATRPASWQMPWAFRSRLLMCRLSPTDFWQIWSSLRFVGPSTACLLDGL